MLGMRGISVALAMLLVTGIGEPAHADEASPAEAERVESNDSSTVEQGASAEQVSEWISQLDSRRFVVRERATRSLLRAGSTALSPLAIVAAGQNPEPADRAIWILRKFAESPDPALRQGALEQIVRLEDQPRFAAWAAERLRKIYHEIAVVAIEELGGRCLAAGNDERFGQERMPKRVILDAKWRGGDAGMRHVADLIGVPMVQIIRTDVSPEGILYLRDMRELRFLHLYGTFIKPEQVAKLREALPNVTIDYRRGALLGVTRDPPQGAGKIKAKIGYVQPGSAAAAADLRRGDVIATFNGEAVADFETLTKFIAKYEPGDQAELGIQRRNRRLNKTVTFGSW